MSRKSRVHLPRCPKEKVRFKIATEEGRSLQQYDNKDEENSLNKVNSYKFSSQKYKQFFFLNLVLLNYSSSVSTQSQDTLPDPWIEITINFVTKFTNQSFNPLGHFAIFCQYILILKINSIF